ncbi:hypothetical protein M409DRAFT_55495 [Zasmidium cellare ATCC 36951]|uniref:Ig-like domain-containing protein n=1 Tax=Zasmidium cellare ATCC 36951 TaxID=1080233 RepID=A0A6A6CEF6_ZASCE|nr:uncharacterized protein M409DRAFT_55495 [Zasmidium cellare ATCC 36951]KAF2165597.1 hypothetical protein M409DRAFT_55495 [Zasmidium cellare ATCC 36951]
MRPSLTLSTALAATIYLLASPISASPVQARAAATVYEYMSATTASITPATASSNVPCSNATITDKADCPSGCTAAPIAGALGVATDSWSCISKPAETSWTSVKATSTCSPGSAVTTYSLYGGQTELGCKATAS